MEEYKYEIPEGYFERSLEKSLGKARTIRRRSRAVLGAAVALFLAGGSFGASVAVHRSEENRMLAEVAGNPELDIFLMVNGD